MANPVQESDPSNEPTDGGRTSGKGLTHLGKYKLKKKLGQGGMARSIWAKTPSWDASPP
jgi:hypothetical protein